MLSCGETSYSMTDNHSLPRETNASKDFSTFSRQRSMSSVIDVVPKQTVFLVRKLAVSVSSSNSTCLCKIGISVEFTSHFLSNTFQVMHNRILEIENINV